jgi:hypothetical protein
MIDLSTKAGVMRFCELRRAEMAADFNRVGRYECNGFAYGGYVFAQHGLRGPPGLAPEDWATGPKLPRITALPVTLPRIIGETMPWQQITSFFARTVREYSRATRATGVLFMTEAWRTEVEGDKPPDRAYGWVEKQANRKEALMMMLEHPQHGRQMWMADILREPTRLEPWREHGGTVGKGRLANMMGWQQ